MTSRIAPTEAAPTHVNADRWSMPLSQAWRDVINSTKGAHRKTENANRINSKRRVKK